MDRGVDIPMGKGVNIPWVAGLYIGENPLFQPVLFLSKMCVKCRI
jgi:hypothetical protein